MSITSDRIFLMGSCGIMMFSAIALAILGVIGVFIQPSLEGSIASLFLVGFGLGLLFASINLLNSGLTILESLEQMERLRVKGK